MCHVFFVRDFFYVVPIKRVLTLKIYIGSIEKKFDLIFMINVLRLYYEYVEEVVNQVVFIYNITDASNNS